MPLVLGGPYKGGFFGEATTGITATGTLTEGTPPPVNLITEQTLIEVWPISVWFHHTIVGTPASETITITNPSAVTISLTSYVNSNSEYDITGLSQTESFAPGETKTFTVDYNPGTGGNTVETGSLTLNFDLDDNVQIDVWSSKFDSALPVTNVTTAQTLSSANTRYVLLNDISDPNTPLTITANHVLLDLNGFTATYGSGGANDTYGIEIDSNSVGIGCRITNGTVEQYNYQSNSSLGERCHGIFLSGNGPEHCQVDNLTVSVDGQAARAIETFRQSQWIHHITAVSKVTVLDGANGWEGRHQMQGSQIRMNPSTTLRRPVARVHDCNLDDAPQLAIHVVVQFQVEPPPNHSQVYNNTINMNGRVTNDFTIFAGGSGGSIFGNVINNASGRGLRAYSGARVFSNSVDTREIDQNVEYGGCQIQGTYGYQLEEGRDGVFLYNNDITVYADTCSCKALRMSTDISATIGNETFNNTFRAVRVGTPPASAEAVAFSEGFGVTVADAEDAMRIVSNTFEFDTHFSKASDSNNNAGSNNWVFRQCTIGLGSNPIGSPMLIYDNSGASGAIDYTFIDCVLNGISYADTIVSQGSNVNGLTLRDQYTITIVVNDGGGSPINGALVVIDDSDSLEVFNQSTGAGGTLTPELVQNERTQDFGQSQVVDGKTPHDILIQAGGFSDVNYQVTSNTPKTLTVNMQTGQVAET